MKTKGKKRKAKNVGQEVQIEGEEIFSSPLNSVSLTDENHFLGFKRIKRSEMFKWDTLEDVNFK